MSRSDTWEIYELWRVVVRFLRARLRRIIATVAAADSSPALDGSRLNSDAVRTILVCRPNAKLGNTLLLTPLLTELHRQYPNASIDLVSSYPRAAQLLRGLPGLRCVLPLSHRPAAAPINYLRQLIRMRHERYDLAIDPSPQSISGRMTLWFSRSQHRLGFTGQNLSLTLTHGCPPPDTTLHESLRPLALLRSIVTDESDMQPPLLHLPLNEAERAAGRAAIQATRSVSGDRSLYVIGYFTDAVGRKELDQRWWRAFWALFQSIEPDALPVEFLRWRPNERIDARHGTLAILCPKQMAAAIAELDLFICADTGPMHLASATPVPTIGLFTITDPERYGPRKPEDLALRVLQVDPAQAARQCLQHLRRCRQSSSGTNEGNLDGLAAHRAQR